MSVATSLIKSTSWDTNTTVDVSAAVVVFDDDDDDDTTSVMSRLNWINPKTSRWIVGSSSKSKLTKDEHTHAAASKILFFFEEFFVTAAQPCRVF